LTRLCIPSASGCPALSLREVSVDLSHNDLGADDAPFVVAFLGARDLTRMQINIQVCFSKNIANCTLKIIFKDKLDLYIPP